MLTGGNFVSIESYIPQLSFSLFSGMNEKIAELEIKGLYEIASVDEKRKGRAKFKLQLALDELHIWDPET